MIYFNKVDGFSDLYALVPKKFTDDRGYFQELYNKSEFENNTHIIFNPVQENESSSQAFVIRGLHFQKDNFAQAKLVKCLRGAIIDVALDIRVTSPSYGKLFAVVLSEKNNKQLFIPKGYAHGFIALNKDTNNVIRYLTDNEYNPQSEGGILFDEEYINASINCAICDEFTIEDAENLKKMSLIFSEKDLKFNQWHKN